jgi:hypothetical protein
MNFEPHRSGGSMLRNQRTRIEAWRRGRRRTGRGPGNQGPAGRRHRECDLSRRASGCGGRNSHHEVAQDAGNNGLRPPRLAIRRTACRVLFPRIRFDGPSLGTDGDRPPQRPRLGVGEGSGSGRFCHLTRLRLAVPSFFCWGVEAPTWNAANEFTPTIPNVGRGDNPVQATTGKPKPLLRRWSRLSRSLGSVPERPS